MQNAPVSKSQFERYLAEAITIAVDAISTFELFYFLTSPAQQKKYAKVFQKHQKVFIFIKPAVFSALILALHKLLEDTGNPVSIYRCISTAEQLSLISTEQKKSLKKKISELKPIWKKVDLLRNKLIAHRDSSISISKVFETANIPPKELRELALGYCDVFNELIKAFGKKPFDPKDYSYRLFQDLEVLVNDLLKAI